MAAIKKKIDDTLDELVEEESSPKKDFKNRTYDAAKRRIDKDNVAKMAVLISFVGTIFFGMAVSYFNEQKILTAEGAILIIGGALIYVGFRMFVVVYNFLALKLQKTAVEIDIKEAKVRRAEAETDAYSAREDRKLEERRLRFAREQIRADKKLDQDLMLRAPLFEEAQKHMMKFFAREDIVTALQVPPTFVEAVERLDDALLKRSSFDVTADKLTARITDVMIQYDNMGRQVKENNDLLNQLIHKDAAYTVKWRETDMRFEQITQEITSINVSMNTLMEMFSDSLIKKIVDKPDPPKTDPPKSLTQELDKLVETKGQPSGPSQDMIEKWADEDAEAVEKAEEKEESSLPPPPAD